jgi:hypothetical protein
LRRREEEEGKKEERRGLSILGEWVDSPYFNSQSLL